MHTHRFEDLNGCDGGGMGETWYGMVWYGMLWYVHEPFDVRLARVFRNGYTYVFVEDWTEHN